MLTDAQIIELRRDPNYAQCYSSGFEGVIRDILSTEGGDFRPDMSFLIRIGKSFVRKRIMREELARSCQTLMESAINRNIDWEYSPGSVEAICSQGHDNYWMRYDEVRVGYLFSFADRLLLDADFRTIVKAKSTGSDPDDALNTIRHQLDELRDATIRSIESKEIYDKMVVLWARDHYRKNSRLIERRFLDSGVKGLLGDITPENKPEA